ncbi:MAG: aldehyde ferredoxin oxidoreductase family protein [Dehalococcoidia bacterium]|nr:aldehyde ferredoxin oxidoreductase family protein [Dehalococcoidia bacterium]
MATGYMGKILFVDLSSGELKEEAPEEKLYRDFIGGYGLGARIIYRRQRGGVDPLGPENHIGFVTGPLTGIRGLLGSRFTVVGKSPLTGCWGDANCGGYFGPYLKFSGYDAVFFNGTSPKPVYLLITDGKAELRDAGHLWGKDSRETEEMLKRELGDKVAVACIGPSGERLSLISCVMHDIGTAAARAGLGAVMGSKKLKAVAVMGTKEVPVLDKERVAQVFKEYLGLASGHMYERLKRWGTCGGNADSSQSGDAPIKNWAGVGSIDFPNAETISDDAVIALQEHKHACLWCPIACKGIMKAGKDYQYKAGGHKPEYETSAAFGMMLLNDNLESIIKANDICNRYGLDTISTGATIAFAMDCYENGIITRTDTGGIDLTWGNHKAIIEMTEKLALREGFGNVLADGVKRAAERIGKGSEQFAIHAGGQELGLHDPRLREMWAGAYMCDPAPGRHTSGAGNALHSSYSRVMDCGGMCLLQFISAPKMDLTKFISAATGWEFDHKELRMTGDRISTIRQAFNVREGIKPRDLVIKGGRPLGNPPLKGGPTTDVTVDGNAIITQFFKDMDWDIETGRPSLQKIQALGLEGILES